MAPILPAGKKRTTARARVAAKAATDPRGKYAPLPDSEMAVDSAANVDQESALSNLKNDYFGFDGDFRMSKKDKRTIKHGNLLAKVREAGIEKKSSKKRRRPNKKLHTDIADLGDALPDVNDDDDWEGNEEEGTMDVEGKKKRRRRKDEGKMVMKSLNLRQGAMKRKRKMEDDEIERMQRNLALLAQGKRGGEAEGGAEVRDAQTQRWEALRAFIGGTMQKDQAFAKT